MWPLPVSDLFFAGKATTGKLLSVGIRTIGELAGADPLWLVSLLKKQGECIWHFANGREDPALFTPLPEHRGYGNSTTTPFDVKEAGTAHQVLLALAETLGNRLRSDGVKIEVVSVGIKYTDFSEKGFFPLVSHQRPLAAATNLTNEIYQAAVAVFQEMWNGQPLRHLGIHTARVDRAVDEIRERYGRDAVMRASFLGQPVAPMEGGV